MLPTESKYGDYPRSGKIDIADVRGNADYSCGNVPLGRQLAGCGLHWGPDPDHNGFGKTVFCKYTRSLFYQKSDLMYSKLVFILF